MPKKLNLTVLEPPGSLGLIKCLVSLYKADGTADQLFIRYLTERQIEEMRGEGVQIIRPGERPMSYALPAAEEDGDNGFDGWSPPEP